MYFGMFQQSMAYVCCCWLSLCHSLSSMNMFMLISSVVRSGVGYSWMTVAFMSIIWGVAIKDLLFVGDSVDESDFDGV